MMQRIWYKDLDLSPLDKTNKKIIFKEMPNHWFEFQTMCFKFAHDKNKTKGEKQNAQQM